MESISQRVPQGERGPYRWGRGRGGPLYGEGQEGERRHKTCQPGRRSYWGKDRNIMGAEYSSWGLSVEFVNLPALTFRVEEFWLGGRSHAPTSLVTAFHPRINDWETEFVKMRLRPFTRRRKSQIWPSGSVWSPYINLSTPRRCCSLEINKSANVGGGGGKDDKRAIWRLTDVWKLSIEAGTWFGGRNMQEAVIWDGWCDAGQFSCSCLTSFLGPIHPCTGQAGPATFCHWIYSVQQLNTFQ